MVKTLPFAVLAYEGPRVRAYLQILRRHGVRPQRIVILLFRSKAKARPRQRPPLSRLKARAQFYRFNYWPLRIRQRYPELYRTIAEGVERGFSLGDGFLDAMLAARPLSSYADEVEHIELDTYRDEGLAQLLDAAAGDLPTLLYTGGDIVPANVLERVPSRFLHVHPGYLPWVRGSDGVLWSTLVRGRPGVSSFYLVPEIDKGEMVSSEELPPLTFRVSAAEARDDKLLYNALFSFYDPVIRACHLGRVIGCMEEGVMPGQAQDTEVGETYRFMHPAIRRRALGRIFVTAPE